MNLSAKEVALAWFQDVWNERKVDRIYELMAPDAVGCLEGGIEVAGPASFAEFHQAFLQTLPDLQVEVLNCVAEGAHVAVLWQLTGRHTGEGFGLAPTGTAVNLRGTTWLEVSNGQVVGGCDCWNRGDLMNSLSAAAPVAD